MKKSILLFLIAFGLVACSKDGFIKVEVETNSAVTETTEVESPTAPTYSKPSTESVNKMSEREYSFDPSKKFVYNGSDKYLKAITTEMVEAAEELFGGQGAVEIPTPYITKIDDSNKNDIKVYGDFWIYGYEMYGTIFNMKNGGSMPGCYHLKEENGEVKFVSKEIAEDGSNNWSSLVKICGGDEDLAKKIFAINDSDEKEENRIIYAKMYADNYGLRLSGIKDYGWPVILFDDISDAEFVYNFYSAYFSEVRQEDNLNDMADRLTRLKEKYMTADLINKLNDMTMDMGADMVIHAQDVTDQMVDSLHADDLGEGYIMVSTETGNDNLAQIKVTLGKVNGKRLITNIE